MNETEQKTLDFIVKTTSERQKIDPMPAPSFYDVLNDQGWDYDTALNFARSYCSFCNSLTIRDVRSLSRQYKDFKELKPKLAKTLSGSIKRDYIISIRNYMDNVYFSKKDSAGNAVLCYAKETEIAKDDLKRIMSSPVIIIDNDDGYEIDAYFEMFNDDLLWTKLPTAALENNARMLVEALTSYIALAKRMISLEQDFPFGKIINEGNAIVLGLHCDFHKDSIYIVLGEKDTGKIYYVSSSDKNDIDHIGAKNIVWRELAKSELAVFGIKVDELVPEPQEPKPIEPDVSGMFNDMSIPNIPESVPPQPVSDDGNAPVPYTPVQKRTEVLSNASESTEPVPTSSSIDFSIATGTGKDYSNSEPKRRTGPQSASFDYDDDTAGSQAFASFFGAERDEPDIEEDDDDSEMPFDDPDDYE